MRRLLLLATFIPCLLAGAERWVRFTSGPFELVTDAGSRPGRETLVRFEEFRHAVGLVAGDQNLETPVPVRIFVFKDPRGWTSSEPIIEGRDRLAIVMPAAGPIPEPVVRALTRLLLEANTARMPAAFERGLIDFFSTLEVSGIRITVGRTPAQPNVDWARVHLLVTSPEYYGKLRVLLYNLRKGVAEDPAYRNAFGKSAAEVEQQAAQYFAAGHFETTQLSSRPMSERDFSERPMPEADAQLARADLLMGAPSAAAYDWLLRGHEKPAEANEGLGLMALREGKKEAAHRYFATAVESESTSARAYIEYAKLEPDNAKADKALRRAAALNPKLDEPFALLAARDTDAPHRILHLKEAAQRNPRNAAYWKALAEAYLAEHNYGEAARAWSAGEQAATDPAMKQQMHAARVAIEGQRLDYEDAERKRVASEEQRELEKLKEQARAEVKALESKYGTPAAPSQAKAVPWWDGPAPAGKARGLLKQVDCLGSQARIVMEIEGGKALKLLVTNPGQVMIVNGGEQALGCGAQRARRVVVEYFPKTNSKLATAGEVATIEFQ